MVAALGAQKAHKQGAAERVKIEKPAPPSFDPHAINNPATVDLVGPDSERDAVARAQILLDRFHFSPGEIDGRYGDNLRVAILGFQTAHNLPASGEVDASTWQKLNEDTSLMLIPYTITPDDVSGPFVPIPKQMDEQANLKCTCYASPEEPVGEHFHISPDLLKALNPGKNLANAGEQILVPNVQRQSIVPAARVEVSKSQRTVSAYADDGRLLAQYPATIGSEHDPLPIGEWKIAVVQQNPWFNYNPELFWDANPKDTKARIPPGPNNPVAVVWMGLSKEHYGIHGSPNPGTIGHTESHGCIRLTNWDAEELSQMVQVGTPAILKE
jgi:lipoprotein-anchoring transpeptidase ErfK/SrfK